MTNENGSNSIQNQDELMTEEDRRKDEEEKIKLLKEIEELEKFINNAERTLNFLEQGDVQIENEAEFLKSNAELEASRSSSQNSDPDTDMEYELYKMAGLYCTKAMDTEFVFNVSATPGDENSSAVQFFVENDKILLGRWVLPLGITIEHILAETPLEQPIHSILFIRNCKKHILCYEQRKEQFNKFKESLSTFTNCKIDTNYGYLTVFVDFYEVKNKSTNEDVNFTITLFYGSGKVTPHTIKIDWNLERSPSKEMTLHLRNFAKPFKNNNLEEAFKQIIEATNPVFQWEPKVYVEKEIIPSNMTKSIEGSADSEESDFYDTSRKRKQSQPERPTRSQKVAKKHGVSSEKSEEKNNNYSDLTGKKSTSEDESQERQNVFKAPLAVKPKKTQGQKKPAVTGKKLLPKKTHNKSLKKKAISDRATGNHEASSSTGRINAEKAQSGKELKLQKSENEKENRMKSLANNTKSGKVQKQVAVKTKNLQRTKQLSEIEMNTPSTNTRSRQTKLSFENTLLTKESDVMKSSDLNKMKKNYTSTPMAGNLRKTRQMTLNLSPIISKAD